MKRSPTKMFRKIWASILITVLVLTLSGCKIDETAFEYNAAKSKLEYAENLGGGISAYQVEDAYQDALDALNALGDYKDAPELADRAKKYFYSSGLYYLNPAAKEYKSDTYETAKALLDRIPNYMDASDWLVLNEAIHLAYNGNPDKAATLVNTLPESFDDNFYKTVILFFNDIDEEEWASAIAGYSSIKAYIDNVNEISGYGNGNVRATNSFNSIMNRARNYSPTMAEFFEDPYGGEISDRLFYRYYSGQMALGNDITALDFHPFVQSGNGSQSDDAVFGSVDVSKLFWDIGDSLEASLTENDLLTYYATNRNPISPMEIVKDKICIIKTSNHDEDIQINSSDFVYYFSPLGLAQSADEVRYLCRIYDDYTATYIKSSGGYLYSIETTVKIFDLAVGEQLLECKYHENQNPGGNTSDFDEVWNGTVLPFLSEIVDVYQVQHFNTE